MPSHSKKQHNFMEAIAHSPSFAKKAGVPQSVGKDYVAADKGKTFGKGGNMKRMAGGGETSAKEQLVERQQKIKDKYDQQNRVPIGGRHMMVDEGKGFFYDFGGIRRKPLEKAYDRLQNMREEEMESNKQRLKNMEKDERAANSMAKGGMAESKKMVGKEVAFMKKKGAPAKMIKHEMSEMKGMKAGGRVRRMANGGMGEGDPFARDIDYDAEKAQGAKNLEGIKNFFGFGKKKEPEEERESKREPEGESPLRFNRPTIDYGKTETVTPPKVKPTGRKELPVLNEESENKDRKTSGPQYTSSISDTEGEYSFPSFKPENRPSQAKEPARPRKPTTVSRTRETTSVTAAPSKGKAPAKIDSEKLLRDAEEEVLRKKPTAMTEQMRKAPTINDLYAGQKSMSDEISDALKSFRSSIRQGNRQGKADALNKQSNPPPFDWRERKKNQGKFVIEHEYAKGGKVKRMRYGGEPDSSMDMGQPMRGMASPPAPRGGPMPAMGPEMNPNSIAALQAKYGMRPQGGPPMKAGGSVKKMAEGGYAKADGAASRGKTQPKMVKMAKGGFVKNADGCAQRGRTKAFQVKMKNGGMC